MKVVGDVAIPMTDTDRRTLHDTTLALHRLHESANQAAGAVTQLSTQFQSIEGLLKSAAAAPPAVKTAIDDMGRQLADLRRRLGVPTPGAAPPAGGGGGGGGGGQQQNVRSSIIAVKATHGVHSAPTELQMRGLTDGRADLTKVVADINALIARMPAFYDQIGAANQAGSDPAVAVPRLNKYKGPLEVHPRAWQSFERIPRKRYGLIALSSPFGWMCCRHLLVSAARRSDHGFTLADEVGEQLPNDFHLRGLHRVGTTRSDHFALSELIRSPPVGRHRPAHHRPHLAGRPAMAVRSSVTCLASAPPPTRPRGDVRLRLERPTDRRHLVIELITASAAGGLRCAADRSASPASCRESRDPHRYPTSGSG